jgi:hypothetical protein
MARPKVPPHERRSVTLSAAIPERLKYQAELAAQIEGKTLAAFVEKAVQAALRRVKMPRPTGIPVEMQQGLWRRVKWIDGKKRFVKADKAIRERLSEFVVQDAPSTLVADEIILWDENPAIRFFLRAYLASELLTPKMLQAWQAIREKTVIEHVRIFEGVEYKSQSWDQSHLERYIERHWDSIEQIINGDLSPSALPDEKQVNRAETSEKK